MCNTHKGCEAANGGCVGCWGGGGANAGGQSQVSEHLTVIRSAELPQCAAQSFLVHERQPHCKSLL